MINLVDFRKGPLPTEDEVMAAWQEEYDKPVVSVICTTFNQELYIEDAIRGFLIQKTNFPFEIIIHDDASTDGTGKIIKKYANRYPKIIRTILQKENQYSQASNSVFLISAEFSKGNYIALCEGDDFWIRDNKLQKQKEVMDENPDCSIVVHNSHKLYNKGTSSIFREIDKDYNFRHSDILDLFVQFAPTASYFFKRAVVDRLPAWFKSAPVGDLFIELYSLKIGRGIYLREPYSVYRVGAINSWSMRVSESKGSRILNNMKFISSFDKLLLDFQDSEKKINLRKSGIYKSLAHDICSDNLSKSFVRSNILQYKEIRNKVKSLQCHSFLKYNLYFPFSLIFFNIFQLSMSIWQRGRAGLNYLYKLANRK